MNTIDELKKKLLIYPENLVIYTVAKYSPLTSKQIGELNKVNSNSIDRILNYMERKKLIVNGHTTEHSTYGKNIFNQLIEFIEYVKNIKFHVAPGDINNFKSSYNNFYNLSKVIKIFFQKVDERYNNIEK
jgi:transcription initiation factor IIE alpha subunit